MLSNEAVCGRLQLLAWHSLRQGSIPSPPLSLAYRHHSPSSFACYPRAPRWSLPPGRCPTLPSSSCLFLPEHYRLGRRPTAPFPLPLPPYPPFLFPPPAPHFLYSPYPPVHSYDHCFSYIPLRWPQEPSTIGHPAAADCRSEPPPHPPPSPSSPLDFLSFHMPFQIRSDSTSGATSPAGQAPAWGRDDSRYPAPKAVIATVSSGSTTYRGDGYGQSPKEKYSKLSTNSLNPAVCRLENGVGQS